MKEGKIKPLSEITKIDDTLAHLSTIGKDAKPRQIT